MRVMWGNPQGVAHNQWRSEFSEGKAVGPRMMIASNIVDGPNAIWPGSLVVHNADEGREAVRTAKRAGADFVKVYELIPTDAYLAIALECKAQGIPFAGHVPQRITARPGFRRRAEEHRTSLRHPLGVLDPRRRPHEGPGQGTREFQATRDDPGSSRNASTMSSRRASASQKPRRSLPASRRTERGSAPRSPSCAPSRGSMTRPSRTTPG